MDSSTTKQEAGLDREALNAAVRACYQRYRSLIESHLSHLLALPVGQALYVLDCLCEQPGAAMATRLHAVELDDASTVQMPMVLSHLSGAEEVLISLHQLQRLVPVKQREIFWLTLAATWIVVVPRQRRYLDDPFQDQYSLLNNDEQFRGYLCAELMSRLAGLY
jgi:hypothetical protein